MVATNNGAAGWVSRGHTLKLFDNRMLRDFSVSAYMLGVVWRLRNQRDGIYWRVYFTRKQLIKRINKQIFIQIDKFLNQ
ncbi:Uncharacterised protein [Serratia fonticola]|nr:Uncharacterised protein [Serratia fonticola]